MAPTPIEEALFMSQLLQGLDDDFFSAVPSPDPSPVKTKPLRTKPTLPSTPTKNLAPSQRSPLPSSSLLSASDHDTATFLQGSENWDLDDFSISPVKPSSSKLKCTPEKILPISFDQKRFEAKTPLYVPDTCTRCVVESVTEEFADRRWRKFVSARVQPGEELVDVFLYDDWYPTDIRIDDIFNVLGTFSKSQANGRRNISITSQSNMIILHPDLLLTATALSNAPQCRRKPILSSLVRATSDFTPALVWGNMLHEVMQRCLTEDRWDEGFVNRCIDDAVLGGLGDLVKIGLTEDVARTEVTERAKGLKLFKEKYLSQEPKSTAVLTNTRSGQSDAPSLLAITKLLDIEEDIWSPTYGLKGKLDATVQGIISDPSSSPSSAYRSAPSYTQTNTSLPLELKTGRSLAGMEHRAQTMLYTLLLSERYGVDTKDGLLFYTQSEGEVVRVPRGRNEIRGLIGARNEMAAYMWRRIRKGKAKAMDVDMDLDIEDASLCSSTASPTTNVDVEDEPFLPPPIDDERLCKRCYALDTCLLFRKTHPNHSSSAPKKQLTYDPPIPAFLEPIFDMKTGHLTQQQAAFFRDWERLLALEERDLVRFKRELWTLGAAEREKRGRCFSGMVVNRQIMNYGIGDKTGGEGVKESKIHRYTYSFVRSRTWVPPPSSSPTQLQPPASKRNLLNGHLNIGDPITVSIEPNLLALARGYILELNPEEVVLGVDHILDVVSLKERVQQMHSARDDSQLEFRIDKDELFGGMARVRSNLAQLFYAGGDARRLSLVVDLRKPIFSAPTPPFSAVTASPFNPSAAPHLAHLNPSQLDAMHKVLSAEDYALILGMPGTGKTTVIAALIRELVSRGKTVLLSSYTHSAVDTILMKLDNEGGGKDGVGSSFGVLRLGNVDKVHPDVRKYTLNARRTATTVEQLEAQLMSPPVVATTCLSIEHPLFFRRKFDYCIVDEASQITLPTCLGPLRFADTFVLVGDHFQLPPLVKNPEARKGGLDISLFRRLSEAHPEAVADLRFQYRMNEEIMTLSNRLIYEDKLRCGNEEVAKRALELKDRAFLGRLHRFDGDQEPSCVGDHGGCWLERLADESCKAVFVDTENLPARDSRVGDLVQNTTEAELVRQFTETLIQSGVHESQIGIISLYRQQVKLLQHLLPERVKNGLEILTADRSQGRDKDCIIISLVRSNETGHIGDLVKDWRRMNVSFTRARSKLVVFGSRKTLQGDPLLAQFFDLMQERGWILPLPVKAHTAHAWVFDVCSTPLKRGVEDAPAGIVQAIEGKREDVFGHDASPRKLLGKENRVRAEKPRPTKKMKLASVDFRKSKSAGAGVLKGRPILQDLLGNET